MDVTKTTQADGQRQPETGVNRTAEAMRHSTPPTGANDLASMADKSAQHTPDREEQLKMALSLARGNFPAIKNPEDRLYRIAAHIERALRVDSAAPELLEACKRSVARIHELSDYVGWLVERNMLREGAKALRQEASITSRDGFETEKQVRAAISKAEGK